MYIKKILDNLTSRSEEYDNCAIYPTKILKQYWRENRFSYLDTPRPDYGFMLLLKGEVDFVCGEDTLTADAGNLIFLPKGCRYEAIFRGVAEDLLLCFDTFSSFPASPAPLKLFDKVSALCTERFHALSEAKYSGKYSNIYIQGLFYLLLDSIANNRESESCAHYSLVCRAKELLLGDEDMSITKIAKCCAVSESGLRRIFRDQTGSSPTAYRTEAKLKRASYLLESTNMTVNEISVRLGFFDSAYFCKIFKNHFGLTPTEYSKNKKL